MSIFSRKTSINIFLLSINFILLAIIGQVVMADETTNALLENSIYLYYYESDDQLLNVGESQIYTFSPIAGENITIVSYGLDDAALTSISLFNSNSTLVDKGTTNQVTQKPDNASSDTAPQSPFITAIEYTAQSDGLYYFEVKNESGKEGLIRTMLFVGEPFSQDITLIDELNPLLPSKAFMVAGDPNREWKDESTGDTIQGLRTQVDVLPIERIDRTPDVFLSYSTLSYLPDVTDRLQPVKSERWFNKDDQEIYLVNIRPIPEEETDANRAILENLDYKTYNSNNFFFFQYLFTVGNGSDPVALDRGATCVNCLPRGTEIRQATTEASTIYTASVAETTQITIQGEVVTATIDRTKTCAPFNQTSGQPDEGNPVTITVSGNTTSTTVCVPTIYITASTTFTTGTFVAGDPNTCTGTANDDAIVCTNGDDIIDALAGNDAIIADAGNDTVYGGDGNDFILAGSGDDIVDAGNGDDAVDGGADNDTINLGSGDNVAVGGTGTDTFVIDDTSTGTSDIAGGETFTSSGDGERDTYDYNNNPTGTINLYTDSADVLDFTDYGSGITIYPDLATGSGLTVNIVDGALPSNISGSGYDDIFNLDGSCATGTASGCSSIPGYTIDANGGNDTINTGSGNDTIDAGDGDDLISAGLGTNIINGASGTDTLTYETITTGGVTVDTGSGTVTGSGIADTISNIEIISGTNFNDTFAGDSGDNTFDGLGGTSDTIDYSSETASVYVDLGSQTATGTSIGTDTLINIENIQGSAYDDTLTGNSDSNVINGNGGNDTIQGSAGNDTLDGGAGTDDLLDYSNATGTVTVWLSILNQATSSEFGTDTLSNLENISGGSGNDFLVGSSVSNDITGGAGADSIYGLDGADVLSGDAGNDTIYGGNGNDTLSGGTGNDYLDGGAGTDLVDESANNNDLIVTLNNAIGSIYDATAGETDSLVNIEDVNTGGGDDQFFMSDVDNNVIDAGGGTDTATISGGSGTITVNRTGTLVDVTDTGGGIGADQYNSVEIVNISGSTGNDTIQVADENDNTITGNGGTDTVEVTKNTATSGTITITRTGADVSATGTGIGTDSYVAINTVNATGSTADDTFYLTDANDNTITGNGGTDIVNVSSTAGSTNETITITRTVSDVAVTGSVGIGTDNYNDIDQVNITAGSGDDTFNIFDELDNIFDGGAGNDTADYSFTTADMNLTLNGASSYTITGTGIGTDILLNIENINTGGGNDIIIIQDDADNTVDGNGNTLGGIDEATDIMDTTYSGIITIIRSPADTVTVSGSGFGTDVFIDIEKVNVESSTGDDVFRPSDSNDNDFNAGGGTDWIDYSFISTGVNVDLSTGIATGDGTDTLTGFENISGSTGADTLIGDGNDNIIDGNDGADTIDAGGGNDTIIGSAGNDSIDGGTGTDLIDESANTNDLIVTLSDIAGTGNIVDGAETDTVDNVENVYTGSGDDQFFMSDSNDNIIDANGGTDTITYAIATPITVTIVDNQATIDGSGIGTDTIYNIENIFTDSGDDNFYITGTVDYGLNSSSGADIFHFNSSVDGTLSLETSDSAHLDFTNFTSSGLTIDLSSSVTQTVATSLDIKLTGTFTSISGSGNADSIIGTASTDTIWAGAGDDTIIGGAGDDYIDGGADTDTIDESANNNDLVVTLTNGTGSIVDATAGETDTVLNVENVSTGNGDDQFFISDSDDNIIDAGGETTADVATVTGGIGTITIIRTGADVTVSDGSGSGGIGSDQYLNVEQVNVSGTSGNNVFTINDSFDNIIDGQGGTNEIDYSIVSAVINVEVLSTGTTISSTGIGSDTLINIQNITTGSDNDTFIIEQNSVDNILDAGGGANNIATYTGSGTILATPSGSSAITVQISGSSESDTLANFKTVNFVGDTTDDTFVIQDTSDNSIDGVSGNDTYDASFATSDITVTVSGTTTVTDGGSEIGTDTLSNIDNIFTGAGDDTFTVDTDVAGTYFFDAGGSTLGNTFEFTGGGTQVVNVTIATASSDTDTLDFSQFTGGGLDIDLSNNSTQEVATNIFITFNNFVDNVVGTSSADSIIGNDNANTIDGGAGDDIIDGGAGDDIIDGGADNDTIIYSAGDDQIDGGAGTDTVDYTGAPSSITATLTSSDTTVTIIGTGDTQTITNTEIISGTNNDDTFSINDAVSTTINAGGGTDTVDYSGLGDAITVDLSTGIGNVSGTSSSDDHTLTGVEDVIGSDFNDTIIGNSDDNNLDGGDGNDVIQGNTGNDTINGGNGSDTVSYKDAGSGVNVDLSSGSSSGGDGNDTLTSIENVSGSAYADNISGSSGDNVIYGGGDDDVIYGDAGNDIIYGDSLNPVSGSSGGSDTINGGDGNDIIYGGNDNTNGSDASDAGDVIEGGEGDDTIYGGNNNSGGGSGSDGSDTITDNTNAVADNDTIYGGNNNTSGGTGTDTDSDNINVQEGTNGNSEQDTVTGDNQIDSNQNDNNGTGDDTITADTTGGGAKDNVDYGDDQ